MKTAGLFAAAALAAASCGCVSGGGSESADWPYQLKSGDRILLCGDSITDMAYSRDWGYYHLFTNALAKVHGDLGVRVADIGLSGRTVGSWYDERENAVAGKGKRRFGEWDMAEETTNHQDVVTLFLGMNDILCPTIADTAEDVAEWGEKLRRLVRALKSATNPRVFVIATVTPLTSSEYSPKNIVRGHMNFLASRIAREEGCRIAHTGYLVETLIDSARNCNPDYHPVPDCVHPDANGHVALAYALALGIGDDALVKEFKDEYDDMRARVGRSWLVADAGDRPEAWDLDAPFVWGKPRKWLPDAAPPSYEADLVDGRGFDRPLPVRPTPAGVGTWTVFTPGRDWQGRMDPDAVDANGVSFGSKVNALYAARWIKSDADRDVELVVSHSGFSCTLGLRTWVNGEKAGDVFLDRFGGSRQVLKARLRKGWNRLLVRADHCEWQFVFSVAVKAVGGDEIKSLEYSVRPRD